MTEASYTAKDITVLEGLEPVRLRPGMYVGSTGPRGLHHLVYEVVDNSVDEAMAGEATRIDVTLLAAEIRARLQEGLGETAPRGLRFAPGRLPEASPEQSSEGGAVPVRPSAEERARGAEIAASIDAGELRETVARAAAASLARAAADRRFC